MERNKSDSNPHAGPQDTQFDLAIEPRSPEAADQVWREVESAWQKGVAFLQKEQTPDGHWVGQLSTSALSTATAVSAMVQAKLNHCVPSGQHDTVEEAIQGGCRWLIEHQNSDGGWGDTDRSHSNIATTLLAIAATRLAGGETTDSSSYSKAAWEFVDSRGRWDGLRRRYGKDKTFVVPILSNCALAGLVPWSEVSALPFEAAWLPQRWYRLAKMPVVSYAVPALVAIGQARFHFSPPRFPMLRWLRQAAIEPTLKVLARMQPESGGYLEATPLTSFVLMNLAAIGKGKLPVSQSCLRFILDSRLSDGSWPIDTNLATWGTSLAWHALSRRQSVGFVRSPQENLDQVRAQETGSIERSSMSEAGLNWLIGCQHRKQHPFTGATPGGWGWTDLSGAVPDADDTPAALLALRGLDWTTLDSAARSQVLEAVGMGLDWLVQLQNRDGGWPTFCRGWGTLPFDRSGSDLTAHALRAIESWRGSLDEIQATCKVCPSQKVLERAAQKGLRFLIKSQKPDGSWLPLWFGNQDREEEDNPFYGTGKVLLALAKLDLGGSAEARRAMEYLVKKQNPDGGWGGTWPTTDSPTGPICQASTVEESAVVLEGLIACSGQLEQNSTIMRGLQWIASEVNRVGLEKAQPIGFYFAKLWYYERLYPALFSLSALGTALRNRR
jgi:squalene-hopene/tetraprenyl-beta-curcumene cyclase